MFGFMRVEFLGVGFYDLVRVQVLFNLNQVLGCGSLHKVLHAQRSLSDGRGASIGYVGVLSLKLALESLLFGTIHERNSN